MARKWPTLHEPKERLYTKYRTDFSRACQKSCQTFCLATFLMKCLELSPLFFRRVDLIIAHDKTL